MGFDPISLGLSAVGGLAGALSQRSANKKADKEQVRVQGILDSDARKYDEYQKMLQASLGGNSAIFGPQTTSGSSSSYGNSTTDSESTPTMSAEYTPLVGQLRKVLEDRMTRGTSLPPGYRQMQEREIASSYKPQEIALRNLAARRGLSTQDIMVGSPVEAAKASAFADVAAKLPLLERQMQNEDIGMGQGLAAAFGKGEKQHSTTSSSQHGSQTSTGPANANAIMNYYSMLAPRETQIAQAPQKGSVLGSALQGGVSGYGIGQSLPQRQPAAPAASAPGMPSFWDVLTKPYGGK